MNSFMFKLFMFTLLTSKFEIVFLNKIEQNCETSILHAYPALKYYLTTAPNEISNLNNEFETYTQQQILYVVTNETQSEFCGGSFPGMNITRLKNYTDKYANVSSEKFCIGVNQTIIESKKPASVLFFLNAMKNNSRCAFICTKNLNNELVITCPLVLSLYTDRNISDSKTNNNTKVSEEPKNRESNLNEISKVESASKTTSGVKKNRNVITGKKTDIADYKKLPINAEFPSKNAPPPSVSKDDGDSNPGEPSKKLTNLSSQVPNVMTKSNSDEESHLFIYFVLLSILCIGFYVLVYNKKKILALMIEGRRKNGRRRPNTATYSKLNCNLEEAMLSGPTTSTANTLLY